MVRENENPIILNKQQLDSVELLFCYFCEKTRLFLAEVVISICDNLMVPTGGGSYKCPVCGCEEGDPIY